MRRFLSAEILAAFLVLAGACVAFRYESLPAYEGQVVAKRRGVDSSGAPVTYITVGWRSAPDRYEQDTRAYPSTGYEALRFGVGDCVTVQPYAQGGVQLSPCP